MLSILPHPLGWSFVLESSELGARRQACRRGCGLRPRLRGPGAAEGDSAVTQRTASCCVTERGAGAATWPRAAGGPRQPPWRPGAHSETEMLPEPLSPSPPLKPGLQSGHPPQVPSHGGDELTVSGFLDHLYDKRAHSGVQTQTSHSAPDVPSIHINSSNVPNSPKRQGRRLSRLPE